MGFVNRLFGKHDDPPEDEDQSLNNLAFVLLSEPRLPEAGALVAAFSDFAEPGLGLQVDPDGKGDQEAQNLEEKLLMLKLNSGEQSFVALMPAPVPNREADDGAQFSVSSFRNDWKLPAHHAHLVVTLHSSPDSTPLARLSKFTSLLAAVTKVSPAVGVYWGNAGATHDAEFFTSLASEQGVVPRIMLWSGVSIAREKDGRLSLLSLGMRQLELPDLLLVAGQASSGVALETMFDLLAYVADRGEMIPEGDTIGRTAEEKLQVRYVRSPLDSGTKVWRVELP